MYINLLKHLKLEQYDINAETLLEPLGCSTGDIHENIIVSPIWSPFDIHSFKNNITANFGDRIYNIMLNGKPVTYLKTGIGAANLGDILLTVLCSGNIRKAIFIGTAGALNKYLEIGNIICPDYASECSGYNQIFTLENISGEISRKYYSSCGLNDAIKSIDLALNSRNVKTYYGVSVFTTPSLICEFRHLKNLIAQGYSAIEMELSVFLSVILHCGIESSALLVISDNIINGSSIYKKLNNREKVKITAAMCHISELIKSAFVKE